MNSSGTVKKQIPQQTVRKKKKEGSLRNFFWLILFFPVSLFYMELVLRGRTFGDLSFGQFFLILFFSASSGALLAAILSLIRNRKAVRITAAVVTGLLFLMYGSQMVYYTIFKSYYSLESAGMAGTAIRDFFGRP